MVGGTAGAFGTTRAVVLALAGGVGMMWVAAWVVTDGGVSGLSPDVLALPFALALWAVIAVPAFGAALFFRNRAAGDGPGAARSSTRAAGATGGARQTQTSLIVAHALLEGPALLGGVLFLLLGHGALAAVALPVYALGVLLAWPRQAWFGEDGDVRI